MKSLFSHYDSLVLQLICYEFSHQRQHDFSNSPCFFPKTLLLRSLKNPSRSHSYHSYLIRRFSRCRTSARDSIEPREYELREGILVAKPNCLISIFSAGGYLEPRTLQVLFCLYVLNDRNKLSG